MLKKILYLLASFTLLVACTKTTANNSNNNGSGGGGNTPVSNSNVGVAVGG